MGCTPPPALTAPPSSPEQGTQEEEWERGAPGGLTSFIPGVGGADPGLSSGKPQGTPGLCTPTSFRQD